MLLGPLPDALSVVKVANALSDAYPLLLVEIYEPVDGLQAKCGGNYAAQLVELYEDVDLIGAFETRGDAFVRGYYFLETATRRIRYAAHAALLVFLGDRADRAVIVRIVPISKARPDEEDEMKERFDRVMMDAAWAKDTAQGG